MHPYRAFPDRQFWNRTVATTPWAEVFLGEPAKFRIGRDEGIASAGSCFARRIAEHLAATGYNYAVYEPCHPLMADQAADYGYGAFSCRYGNIYTARQLRQLFDEALGVRPPIFHMAHSKGGMIDLLRPTIAKQPFASADELKADRTYHLSRVREMIEQMETFVFTLGLTETWTDAQRNVVYGSHPGVFVDQLDASHITAVNLEYEQVVADMEHVLSLIARHSRRGGAKVILTVSPVALAATHQDDHVLTATSYSKAVLRAAAGKLAATHPNVAYFPSYEIFALSPSFGQFLAEDLRDVSPRGVDVAMRVFSDMFLEAGPPQAAPAPKPAATVETKPVGKSLAEAECDEIANAMLDGKQSAS